MGENRPAMSESAPKDSISIELTPAARRRVDELGEETGIKKKELVARIIEGFAALEPAAQTAWVQRDDERKRALLLPLLRRMAGEHEASTIPGEVDHSKATAIIRELLDRNEVIYKATRRALQDQQDGVRKGKK